jgi:hypothetical protein
MISSFALMWLGALNRHSNAPVERVPEIAVLRPRAQAACSFLVLGRNAENVKIAGNKADSGRFPRLRAELGCWSLRCVSVLLSSWVGPLA